MDGVINTKSEENFVGTQMTIIKSVRVMGDARAALAVKYPQYAGSAAPVPEIAVSMIPRMQIFVITGTGPDPEYTQLFVNALIDSFIEYRRITKGDAKSVLLLNMEKQIAQLQTDLTDADAKLRAFTSANKIGFWEEQMKSSPKYLSELKDRPGEKSRLS